ncbi:ABC transporter ATP-binding protein [Nocardioides sp.]|uniref:ATP-binding cassette domain-containing protein n=1 Tax=Nocardioides sp. TaxID=35761 RepID=UPI00262E3233|nr:ABC transporter ATP-binding protein [Nocardioides sp.]
MAHDRAVRARGITKYYGDVVALDGVDLDLISGQIHGLVGPNGAGKTTLLGLLLGLAGADAGTLEILGHPAGHGLAVPDGVAGFVDGPGLYPALTARANLAAVAALQPSQTSEPRHPGRRDRSRAADEVEQALRQVGLLDVADDRVRGFSLGMRQRLGLASALLLRPRLLVLDEPANGLDPAGRRHVHDVLTTLADQGCAIVVSSHRMDDIAALCSEVTLLTGGRVVFSGPIAKLAAEAGPVDYRVLTATGQESTVRGTTELDALVATVLAGGGAIREVAPVVPPLEAAFLALTAGETR